MTAIPTSPLLQQITDEMFRELEKLDAFDTAMLQNLQLLADAGDLSKSKKLESVICRKAKDQS